MPVSRPWPSTVPEEDSAADVTQQTQPGHTSSSNDRPKQDAKADVEESLDKTGTAE